MLLDAATKQEIALMLLKERALPLTTPFWFEMSKVQPELIDTVWLKVESGSLYVTMLCDGTPNYVRCTCLPPKDAVWETLPVQFVSGKITAEVS